MSDRLASFVPFLVSVGWLAICLNQENIFIYHLILIVIIKQKDVKRKITLDLLLPMHEMKYQKVE